MELLALTPTRMKFLAPLLLCLPLAAAELPDIRSVPPDLIIPPVSDDAPAAAKRVRQGFNVLYLPSNWQKSAKWPVIVELAGNGGYANQMGDVCTGLPEGSKLGFGLSGGRDFIWLCVPYLNAKGDQIAIKWWGDPPGYDPQPTLKNLRGAVRGVCRDFNGDPARVVLAGFSRGAIACNFLGLHDDETARLWCAFLPTAISMASESGLIPARIVRLLSHVSSALANGSNSSAAKA